MYLIQLSICSVNIQLLVLNYTTNYIRLTCLYFEVPYQASYSWLMTVVVVFLFHTINSSHQQWVPGVWQFVHPLVAIRGPLPVSSYMDRLPDPVSLLILIVTLTGQYRGFVPVYHMVALGGVISKGWLFLFILCLRFSGAGELLARHSLDWVLVFLESARQVPSSFTNVGGVTVGTRDFVYKVTCVKPEAWVMREKRVVPAGVIGRCRTQKTRCHL